MTTSTAVLDELVAAINARMIAFELAPTGETTTSYENPQFDGLPIYTVRLRPEYRETWSSAEAFHAHAECAEDTPFLSADQEEATGDAMFWVDDIVPAGSWRCMSYAIDPSKAEAMLAYVTQARFHVHTDDERAEDLCDAKMGI